MNVLYAGIDNPISIAVPGIPMSSINASMTNGSLTRNGDKWIARPAQVGSDAEITVTARLEGGNQRISSTTFRVRRLPTRHRTYLSPAHQARNATKATPP